MNNNVIGLFDGLMKSAIPMSAGGLIFNTRFHPRSNYAVFEIIAFKNVKNIIHTGDNVTFQSDGYKTFLLYEPKTYRTRYMEPYLRDDLEHIPLRFNELHILDLPNRDRILISREPYLSHGSFSVEKPDGGNFVYYFFEKNDMEKNIGQFMNKVLKDDFKVPSKIIGDVLKIFHENISQFRTETAHIESA